ncbi:MAG: HAD family hydrolase [Opitutales bacterium]
MSQFERLPNGFSVDGYQVELIEKISRSKAVFFDLFHTLVYLHTEGPNSVNTYTHLGFPHDVWFDLIFESSEERLKGKTRDKYAIIRDLAHEYDPSIDEALIRFDVEERVKRFQAGFDNLTEERFAVIQSLKHAGLSIGLIGNADAVEITGWYDSKISRLFDSVIFSFDVGAVKPEPAIYEIALESLGVSATESVFVGDGASHKLKGTRELGFTTVMTTEILATLWPEKIPARTPFADYVVSRLSELVSIPDERL